MKNLRQKLVEDLRYYEIGSKIFDPEDILEIPGFDFDFNWLALKRERLEKNKSLLTQKELQILEEADLRFIELWGQVKDKEPKIPHNKIAKAFLEDIVKIAKHSLSTKTV
jgi:hypothetical protein